MKKIVEFLKWPLSYPLTIMCIVSLYWVLFYPMDFYGGSDDNLNAFQFELGLFVVLCFFAIISRLSRGTWVFFILALILYWIALGANALYTIMYFPQVGETAEFGGFKYYEVATADSDYHGLVLFYKCKKWSFDCQILSGNYSLTGTKIIIDEQQNEVSWFETGFQRLLITDGGNFRGYTGLSAQFQGHQYQISDRCNKFSDKYGAYSCESYTYILYQCNLEYTACKPLPIQYTTDFDVYLDLIVNEETNELELHKNYDEKYEPLILTYGEHVRCYVEGCEILEKQK